MKIATAIPEVVAELLPSVLSDPPLGSKHWSGVSGGVFLKAVSSLHEKMAEPVHEFT